MRATKITLDEKEDIATTIIATAVSPNKRNYIYQKKESVYRSGNNINNEIRESFIIDNR